MVLFGLLFKCLLSNFPNHLIHFIIFENFIDNKNFFSFRLVILIYKHKLLLTIKKKEINVAKRK